jgi:hypothetical protein
MEDGVEVAAADKRCIEGYTNLTRTDIGAWIIL